MTVDCWHIEYIVTTRKGQSARDYNKGPRLPCGGVFRLSPGGRASQGLRGRMGMERSVWATGRAMASSEPVRTSGRGSRLGLPPQLNQSPQGQGLGSVGFKLLR